MRLSIFNFDHLRELRREISLKSRAVASLLLALALTLMVCFAILRVVFERPDFQTMATMALSPETEILAIGSSRVFFGIDPRAYPQRLVGLAANYLDYASAERLWLRYEARLPKLKLLLLEFDGVNIKFDTSMLDAYGLRRLGVEPELTWSHFCRDFDGSMHKILWPFFRWRLTPEFLRTEEQVIGGALEPHDLVPGFIPSKEVQAYSEVVTQSKILQADEQIATQGGPDGQRGIEERNYQALKRLLEILWQKQSPTLLVRFPLAPKARSLIPERIDRVAEDVRLRLGRELAPRRFAELKIIDLSRDETFVSEEFRDPDHLNERGAQRLAQILAPLFRSLNDSEQ